MKHIKKACAGLLLLTMGMSIAAPAVADSGNTGLMGISVGEKNFPDEAFRTIVATTVDTDQSGVLSKQEVEAVTDLSLDAKGIKSLEGIGYFENLTDLSCANNQLSTLDLEKNTALERLNCAGNQLTALDLAKNATLTALDVSNNHLTNLDLSANTALTDFACDNNSYDIALTADRTFDLSRLPGKFNTEKSFSWEGATVDATTLTANEDATQMSYSYDCGNGQVVIFTLKVKEGEIAPSGAFTITFDANGGNMTPSSATTTDGKLANLPTPTRDGYSFDGWKNQDGKVVDVNTVYQADTTLIAQWKKDVPTTNPFFDVNESQWFYDDVQYAYENGLLSGTAPNTFSPFMSTTRGMIVTILYRMEGSPDISGENLGYPFADVNSNAYYADAVYWARNNKIVSGYSADQFGPNDPITREQLAAFLYNYSTYKKYDTSKKGDLNTFYDANDVHAWAKGPVEWAVGSSLIGGVSDGVLMPQGSATRAQVAAILHRYSRSMD